jgi:hypothetical protein
VILKKLSITGLLLLLLPYWVCAQILDDSTKVLYGPSTTKYILEKDMLANRKTTYRVDTLIDNFHNYNFVNRFGNRYTDLGNLGTPLRSVFYSPPPQIGTYLGIDVYDKYMYNPEDIRYYDTKSPYTNLYYVQGGLQQALFNVDFSRNILPNWNAGINYLRLTSPRQFGISNYGEDRQTDHHAFAFHTRYFTKDSTYQVIGHFSHLNHEMKDQGGIVQEGDDTLSLDSLFNYRDEQQKLHQTRAKDFRNNFHVYHQYAFARGFHLYHILDIQRRTYDYRDYQLYDLSTTPQPNQRGSFQSHQFYPDVYFKDTTDLSIRYMLYENQAGIKGSLDKLDYRFYARRRDYRIQYKPAYLEKKVAGEQFLGGWINYNFSDSARLHAEAEYLLFRDYRLSAEYQTRYWRIGHNRMFYSPTLIQQRIENNHFIWDNDFRPTLSDNTYAYLTINIGQLHFAPFATFTNLDNYVYYDQLVQPQQEGRAIQILTGGLNLNFNWKNIHTVNQVVYTKITGPNKIRIPEWFGNFRLYYQNRVFKVLDAQFGVDVHYKSDYTPYGYMPAIGQYHLQDNFVADAYLVADLFANIRINRVRLFVKFAHANQGLTSPGYFVAPYITGLPRTLALGASWQLFD